MRGLYRRADIRHSTFDIRHSTFAIVVFFSLTIGFSSCKFFQNNILEYLDENTSSATIFEHNYLIDNKIFDKDRKLSIQPEEDCTVLFSLRNPKNYGINFSILFTDKEVQKIYENNPNNVEFTQKSSTQIALTFKKDFLLATGNGKDLDANIILNEGKTGREFPSYKICDARSNSVPIPVTNLAIMQAPDRHARLFVLCFDMPNLRETIHQADTKTLVIEINPGGTNPYRRTFTFDPSAQTVNELNFSTTEPGADPSALRTNAPEGLEFSYPNQEYTPTERTIYFLTGQSFEKYCEFKVYIIDDNKLEKEVMITTQTTQLNSPIISDATPTQRDEDGNYLLEVTVDRKADSTPVEEKTYLFYSADQNAGNPIIYNGVTEEPDANGKVYIKLPPGTNSFFCRQTSPLYYDSNNVDKNITVPLTKMWIDVNSQASYELGSKDYPMKNFGTSYYKKFTSPSNRGNIIYLLSSIGSIIINNSSNFKGTIQSADTEKKNINSFNLDIDRTGESSLKNLKIDFLISKGTVNADDCEIGKISFNSEQYTNYNFKNTVLKEYTQTKGKCNLEGVCSIEADEWSINGNSTFVLKQNSILNVKENALIKILKTGGTPTINLDGKLQVENDGKVKLYVDPNFTGQTILITTLGEDETSKFILVDESGNPITYKKLFYTNNYSGGQVISRELKLGNTFETIEFCTKMRNAGGQNFTWYTTITAKDSDGNEVDLTGLISDIKCTWDGLEGWKDMNGQYNPSASFTNSDNGKDFTVKAMVCGLECIDESRKLPNFNEVGNEYVELPLRS